MLRGTNGIDLNKTLRLLYLLCFLASDADGKHLLLMRTEIAIYMSRLGSSELTQSNMLMLMLSKQRACYTEECHTSRDMSLFPTAHFAAHRLSHGTQSGWPAAVTCRCTELLLTSRLESVLPPERQLRHGWSDRVSASFTKASWPPSKPAKSQHHPHLCLSTSLFHGSASARSCLYLSFALC